MQTLARTYYLLDPNKNQTHRFMAGTPRNTLPTWFDDAAPDALFEGDEVEAVEDEGDEAGVASHDADIDAMTKAEIMAELDRLGADYTKRDNHHKLAQALMLARASAETD